MSTVTLGARNSSRKDSPIAYTTKMQALVRAHTGVSKQATALRNPVGLLVWLFSFQLFMKGNKPTTKEKDNVQKKFNDEQLQLFSAYVKKTTYSV